VKTEVLIKSAYKTHNFLILGLLVSCWNKENAFPKVDASIMEA